MSRLDIVDTPYPVKDYIESINEHYGLEDEDISHPTNYKAIMQNQHKDKELINISQNNKDYTMQNFHKKHSLICKICKIVILKQFQKQVVEWYHNALFHPGETCTELSISQHFYWKNLNKTVYEIFIKCETCQFLKRNKKHYGKLPPKGAKSIPWDALCVDLIGKYQVTPRGGGKKFQILPKGDERK